MCDVFYTTELRFYFILLHFYEHTFYYILLSNGLRKITNYSRVYKM